MRMLLLPAILAASIVGFGYALACFRLGLPPPRQRLGIAVLGGWSHLQVIGGVVHLLIGFQVQSLWFARRVCHSWHAVRGSADGEMVRLLKFSRPTRHS